MVPRAEGEGFEALVLYPAVDEQGGPPPAPVDGAPAALLGAPFAAIAFGHGFLQEPERYGGLLAHLASWGYVVVAPSSQTGLAADHAAFASDLSAALAWLEAAGVEDGGWLDGRVDDTRLGLAGHSMGGGAALLAAAADPRVAAWLVLAPAETSPSAVDAMADVSAPGAVLAGDEDVITPLADHARPIFEAGAAPRLLVLLRGGSHCGFQDDPFPIGCQEGSLPWTRQLALTRGWLVTFFDLHLGVVEPGDEGWEGEDEAQEGRFGWSRAIWRDVWGPQAGADRAVDVEPEVGLALNAPPVLARGHGIARAAVGVRRTGGATAPRAVVLALEPGAWPVLGERLLTPLLAAGEGYTATVEIAVPLREGGRLGPNADEAIASAWIDGGLGGRVRAWAPLRVTREDVTAGVGRAWLPWAVVER
jgi:dienelactone hydrolase